MACFCCAKFRVVVYVEKPQCSILGSEWFYINSWIEEWWWTGNPPQSKWYEWGWCRCWSGVSKTMELMKAKQWNWWKRGDKEGCGGKAKKRIHWMWEAKSSNLSVLRLRIHPSSSDLRDCVGGCNNMQNWCNWQLLRGVDAGLGTLFEQLEKYVAKGTCKMHCESEAPNYLGVAPPWSWGERRDCCGRENTYCHNRAKSKGRRTCA